MELCCTSVCPGQGAAASVCQQKLEWEFAATRRQERVNLYPWGNEFSLPIITFQGGILLSEHTSKMMVLDWLASITGPTRRFQGGYVQRNVGVALYWQADSYAW